MMEFIWTHTGEYGLCDALMWMCVPTLIRVFCRGVYLLVTNQQR